MTHAAVDAVGTETADGGSGAGTTVLTDAVGTEGVVAVVRVRVVGVGALVGAESDEWEGRLEG
jgi:hypothetical protein